MAEKASHRHSFFKKFGFLRRGSKTLSEHPSSSLNSSPPTSTSAPILQCLAPSSSPRAAHLRHTRHASLTGHEPRPLEDSPTAYRKLLTPEPQRGSRRRKSSPCVDDKSSSVSASHSKSVMKTTERRGQHKFHKLFNLDSSEPLLKSFPCALVGDILFQGTFYASEHFFCFHSKFAKKRKLIQVAVREVTNLTREKTAGIIPNAIALHTKHSRFVFASIIGRENIFRLLSNMWQSQVSASNTLKWEEDEAVIENPLQVELPIPQVSNDGVIHDSSADTDAETEEEVEVDVEVNCLDKTAVPLAPPEASSSTPSFRATPEPQDIPNGTYSSALPSPIRQYLRGLAGLPRAQLCLLVAYAVLIFLAFSAVVLAWRIYAYQTFLLTRIEQIDGQQPKVAPFCHAEDHDCNLYRLRQQTHSTRIRHVHAVMSSNIRTLADLARRLRPPSDNGVNLAGSSPTPAATVAPDSNGPPEKKEERRTLVT